MKGTGKENILRKVRSFDISTVPPGVVGEVKELLAATDEDAARGASAGAGTFYKWVCICSKSEVCVVFTCVIVIEAFNPFPNDKF